MKNRLYALVLVFALPLLGGCAAALVGGAVGGGVLLANDRRTVGTVTEDQSIEFKGGQRLGNRVPDGHINVTSYNRLVLLSGEVPNAAAREDAENVTRNIDNVRGVFNELQIGPNTARTVRANDAFITSKVKARFFEARQFNPVHVKVVTENGTVFLMGLVNRAEGETASELARTTSGVQKVVRLFEYLD